MSTVRDDVSRAQAVVIPRTYCTSCQQHQPRDGGEVRVVRSGLLRWVCAPCAARMRAA